MSEAVTKPERVTQNRVVKLFCEQLGYEYLGNLENKANNSNIEEKPLRRHLGGGKYRLDQDKQFSLTTSVLSYWWTNTCHSGDTTATH